MRDFSSDDVLELPWAEVQTRAETAAAALGLSVAEAGRFGAAAARHLFSGRDPGALSGLLERPEKIAELSQALDAAVEDAVLGQQIKALNDDVNSVRASFFEGLPCKVVIARTDHGCAVAIAPAEASSLRRADKVSVPETFLQSMAKVSTGARSSPVRGASLMEL